MSFLDTPDESPLYAADLADHGYVPNYTRVFALRPEVYTAWRQLATSVRDGMDRRRFQLVTLAAARRLGSRYCSLAYGKALRAWYDDETVEGIARDHHEAGLDAVDVALMDFAERIAERPGAATAEDAAALRTLGLSDVDIFQVVLAVCLRRFFSGVLDATGAEPDDAYETLAEPLFAALQAVPRAS